MKAASASLDSSAWHHIVCVWHTSASSTNSGNKGYDIYLNATKVGNGFGNYGVYGNGNFITTTDESKQTWLALATMLTMMDSLTKSRFGTTRCRTRTLRQYTIPAPRMT